MIVILLSLFMVLSNAQSCSDWGIRTYDYYMLALSDPISFCKQKACIPSRVKESFSIHGLWPNLKEKVNDRLWPQCCRNGDSVDFTMLKNKYGSQLNAMWPDALLQNPYDSRGLWAHEWRKHGTCSRFNQMEYFGKALQLRKKYDIDRMFRSAGINRDDHKVHSVNGMISAVRNSFGATPVVTCKQINGRMYTAEVRLCFSKSLQPMNCPVQTRCTSAIYPKTVSSSDGMDLEANHSEQTA